MSYVEALEQSYVKARKASDKSYQNGIETVRYYVHGVIVSLEELFTRSEFQTLFTEEQKVGLEAIRKEVANEDGELDFKAEDTYDEVHWRTEDFLRPKSLIRDVTKLNFINLQHDVLSRLAKSDKIKFFDHVKKFDGIRRQFVIVGFCLAVRLCDAELFEANMPGSDRQKMMKERMTRLGFSFSQKEMSPEDIAIRKISNEILEYHRTHDTSKLPKTSDQFTNLDSLKNMTDLMEKHPFLKEYGPIDFVVDHDNCQCCT